MRSALQSFSKRVMRVIVLWPLFFLPAERRLLIERRVRGREQYSKLKKADYTVVSFGKSGRTWLRVLLSRIYQLKHGFKERHMIGFDNFHYMNRSIPKIFFTHDNYLKDYTGNVDNKSDYYGKKVVLLARHPADIAVSQYFQWKYRMRDRKKKLNKYPDESEISIFNFMQDLDSGLPKIVEFLNLWAEEANEISMLLVRYEDLRADTPAVLTSVLEFLGTPAKPDQISEAIDFASVENMRQLESKRVFWLHGSRMQAKDPSNPNTYKVRRAKVGGYRDYLTDEEITWIDSYISENLSGYYQYS